MDWNPVLEHRLKEAKQKAGWRWIAYFLTFVGLAVGFGGPAIIGAVSPDSLESDPKGVLQVSWILAGMILLLAIVLDVPAEKAAKEAKELKVQKEASLKMPSAPAPQACAKCGTGLAIGTRFCGSCGAPAA